MRARGNDINDLCTESRGGGGGGGGGDAASFSPFSWREEVVIHIIRAVLRCTTHYLVFNDPIYGQHLGYVLTHSPVHYAHHPVEFP